MNPSFFTRFLRIALIVLLILVIRRVPKQFFFGFVQLGMVLLIFGSLMLSWHRFTKKLKKKNSASKKEK